MQKKPSQYAIWYEIFIAIEVLYYALYQQVVEANQILLHRYVGQIGHVPLRTRFNCISLNVRTFVSLILSFSHSLSCKVTAVKLNEIALLFQLIPSLILQ